MERIVTAAQARQRDREVIASGVSSLALMRTAAEGLVSAVKDLRKNGESVTAISGTGNNGGDGIAAAWLLKREGVDARIVLSGNEKNCTPDAAYYLGAAKADGVPVFAEWEPKEHEILIDALFGVGLNRPVEGAVRDLIVRMNESGKSIVSADIPSGLHADSGEIMGAVVHAARTVTMQAKRRACCSDRDARFAGRSRYSRCTQTKASRSFFIRRKPKLQRFCRSGRSIHTRE